MTRKCKMGDKVKHGGSTYVFFCYPTNEDNTVDRNTVRSGQVPVYLDSATNNTPNFFTPVNLRAVKNCGGLGKKK